MKITARVKTAGRQYMNVATTDLLIDQEHGLFHNIRGAVGVTVDLQQSLPKDGQIKRIQVIPHPEWDGKFLVIDGHRRTVAARKAGVESMKVEVLDISLEEVTKFMLLSAMREEIPDVALDSKGNVVGGYCYAVHDLIDNQGMKRMEVARLTGIKPDTISALNDLYSEPVAEIRRAVAQGRMGITAYWRIRRLPDEDKREILALKGDITRKKIETYLQRKSDEAAAPLDTAAEAEQASAELEHDPIEAKFEFIESRFGVERTQAGVLSEALSLVRQAMGMETTTDGRHVAGEIVAILETI